MQNAAGDNRFQTLDGLRGLGAIAVVLLHFGASLGIATPIHGYLAVDLFFCLSGFVLTRSYADKIIHGMKFESWVLVRLIRLYPLFFLSMMLGAAAMFFDGMPGSSLTATGQLTAFATGLLMVPSPTWNQTPETFPLNFVAWSLSIELLLSMLFYWACRWSGRRVVLLCAIGLVGLAVVRWRIGYVGGGFAWRDAPTGLARGLYGFSVGMLIARHSTRRVKSKAAWAPVIAAGAMMWVAPPHGVAYDLLAIIMLVPIITFAASCLEPQRGKFFRLLGDVSYAVYALQIVTFSAIERVLESNNAQVRTVIGILIVSAFIGLCALLDRLFDRPIRNALSTRLRIRVSRLAAP